MTHVRSMQCTCPCCDGEPFPAGERFSSGEWESPAWESPAEDERLCVQCGEPVLPGDAALWGPEGFLHSECSVEYAFLDPTRDELLAFVELYLTDFVQYVTELRNFRSEEVRL